MPTKCPLLLASSVAALCLSGCVALETKEYTGPSGELVRFDFIKNVNLFAPSVTAVKEWTCHSGESKCVSPYADVVDGQSLLSQVAMPGAIVGSAVLWPADVVSTIANGGSSSATAAGGTATATAGASASSASSVPSTPSPSGGKCGVTWGKGK